MKIDVDIPACKRMKENPNWCHMKMYDEALGHNGGRFWTKSMRCATCGIFRYDEVKTVDGMLEEWRLANED